jgi:hypothetical protein
MARLAAALQTKRATRVTRCAQHGRVGGLLKGLVVAARLDFINPDNLKVNQYYFWF